MDKQPALRPELTPFVDALESLFARSDWPGAAERVAALQQLGLQIHSEHGYEGMVNVCDRVRVSGNAIGASELEGLWDGIGEWRR